MPDPNEPSSFRTVARVGEIPDGQGRPYDVGDRVIAVFNDGGTYFATDDACPHKGIPLCDGIVYDRTVTCTWHGWCFDLATGQHRESGRMLLGTYPVRLVGNEIQVAVD